MGVTFGWVLFSVAIFGCCFNAVVWTIYLLLAICGLRLVLVLCSGGTSFE